MADRRIQIAKDKAELVRRLAPVSGSTHPPFKSYAAAVAFAAAYGSMHNVSSPLDSKCSDPEPIRTEIFRNQNLYTLIELLALYKYNDPIVLADTPESEEKRISAFEEYANGGLEILMKKCEGKVDVLDALVLLLCKYEQTEDMSTVLGGISEQIV